MQNILFITSHFDPHKQRQQFFADTVDFTPPYTIPQEGSTVESAPAISAGSKSRSVLGICGKFTPSA